jgi:hypothetical protein
MTLTSMLRATASGDASTAAYAGAVNRDELRKMMLENKTELLFPPESGDFSLKSAAKGSVGDVAQKVVDQCHGLSPSE